MPAGERRTEPVLKRYFTYRLNNLSKLNDLASQAMYRAACGLSLAETRCLAAVGSFPQITVTRLAFETNLDKTQASRTAHALVARGLMERSKVIKMGDKVDARSVGLSLTAAGKTLFHKVMAAIERRNQELMQCLNECEQALLLEFFDRMLQQAPPLGRLDTAHA